MGLILSTFLLDRLIPRLSGRARTAGIGLVIALRLGGGAVAFRRWRLHRHAVRKI